MRTTQFFEFVGRIADGATGGDTVCLSPAMVRSVAADDVAVTLADARIGSVRFDDWLAGAGQR